jgi:hypothetical protein
MTGRGMGFCILAMDPNRRSIIDCYAGCAGAPLSMAEETKGTGKEMHTMPGGDRTGPAGMGPMTGRAAGYCAGYAMPGYANPLWGRGFGWGRGGGFGRGRGLGFRRGRGGYWRAPFYHSGAYGAAISPYGAPYGAVPGVENEVDLLKGQAEYFEDALESIKKRIAELEAAAEKSK